MKMKKAALILAIVAVGILLASLMCSFPNTAIANGHVKEVKYDKIVVPARNGHFKVDKIVVPGLTFDPPKIKVPLDSTKATNVIINSAPNGLSGYNITISLSKESVAEITSVDFPSWASITSNTPLPADSVGIKAADFNHKVESGAMNVTLATLTIRGDKLGSDNILITDTKMDDDNGYPINAITIPGQVNVVLVIEIDELAVIPFPGCDNPPTDPDNDLLYKDINGNGRKDFNDVVCFFENLEWAEKNQPCYSGFDFNKNGRIDFDDVVKLFEEI